MEDLDWKDGQADRCAFLKQALLTGGAASIKTKTGLSPSLVYASIFLQTD